MKAVEVVACKRGAGRDAFVVVVVYSSFGGRKAFLSLTSLWTYSLPAGAPAQDFFK